MLQNLGRRCEKSKALDVASVQVTLMDGKKVTTGDSLFCISLIFHFCCLVFNYWNIINFELTVLFEACWLGYCLSLYIIYQVKLFDRTKYSLSFSLFAYLKLDNFLETLRFQYWQLSYRFIHYMNALFQQFFLKFNNNK